MPDYSAGTAYLSVVPTLLGDKASMQRQLDTALAGIEAKIPVQVQDPSIVAAKAKVEELTAEVESAAKRQIAANAEVRAAEEALNETRSQGNEEQVAAAEALVTESRDKVTAATRALTAVEGDAGTTEDVLRQHREAVTRATSDASAADNILHEARQAGTATDAEVSSAESRVADAHEAASKASADATSAAERLGTEQSTLKRLLDDSKKSTDDNKSSLDKFSDGADKAATGMEGLASKALGFEQTAVTGLGLAGLVQGALSLTSALLPAVGALGLLPAVGLAGAAAIGTLKIGTSGFGAAIKDIGTPKFAADLAKLAPSAQDAAKGIASLKPAYDSLQLATQQSLFLGLGDTIRSLGADYLPIARTGFTSMASSMNAAIQQIAAFLKAPAVLTAMRNTTDNVTTGFRNFSGAIEPGVQALERLVNVGSSFLPGLGTQFANVAKAFSGWVDKMVNSGQLWNFINTGINVLTTLGALVSNVGVILMRVLQASAGAGANMLGVLVQLTGGARDFLNSTQGISFLSTIFDNIHTALMAVSPLVAAVGNGLKEVLPPVSAALIDVGKALGSLAPEVPKVVDVIKQLAPIAGQLAGVLAGMLTGAINVLAPIVRGLGSALSGIMPTLKDWAPTLGVIALGLYGVTKAVSGVVSAVQGINAGVKAFKDFQETLAGFTIIESITEWVKAFSLAETIAAVQAKAVAVGEALASAAATVWTGIQTALDIVLDANPIGLVVIAIVALIAIIVLVITHFQTFKDIVSVVWDFIRSTTMTVWNAVSGFLVSVVTSIGAFFTSTFNAIAAFFVGIWNGIRNVVMTVWNAIASYIMLMFTMHYALWVQIWNAISGFFTTIWNAIRNTAVTVWNAISGFLVGAFNAFVAFFESIWNAVSSFFMVVWNAIRNTAVTVWNAIVAFLQPAINAFSAFFQSIWNAISAFFMVVWNAVRNTAVTVWNAIVAFLQPAINAFSAFFSSVWNAISAYFSNIWNAIKTDATTIWNAIASFFSGAFAAFSATFSAVWNGIAGVFHSIWTGISADAGAIWNGIVAVVKGAVNGVIGAANWMVGGVNKVLSFLAIPNIPTIPGLEAGGTIPAYAAGTQRIGAGFKTSGPTAVVGEGGPHPEYVIPTDPKYKARATALHAAAGADLGVMPQMAIGGVIGDIGSWIGSAASSVGSVASSAFGAVQGALGDIGQWVGGGFDALMASVKNALGGMIPKGLFSGIGNFFVDKLFPAIQAKITAAQAASTAGGAFVGPGGAAPAGAIGAWISQALAILGYPQNYAEGIAEQIHSESGGNPNAIQGNIGDVNNASGDLAKGIMQVISTTFASNALPGHGNIFNPVDNIIAGSRYAMAKYGASWFEPGAFHNHGYATGGVLPYQSFDIPVGSASMLPAGLSLTHNGTGSPEMLTRVASGTSYAGNDALTITGSVAFDPSNGLIQFTDARISDGLVGVAAGLNNGPRG